MKNLFLTFFMISLAVSLQAQPPGFEYTSEQQVCAGLTSYAMLGIIEINGVSPGAGSWIAAFDETNILAGSGQLVINNGIASIQATQVNTDDEDPAIQGPPNDCGNIDSGINGFPSNPERYYVVVWNSTDGKYYQFPDDSQKTLFDYSSASGIYLDDFSDFNSIIEFVGNGFTDLAPIFPVELIFFNGRLEGKSVELRWATASEQNSSHFVVQRSADGKQFNAIGQIASAGDSQVLLNYQFMDRKPLEGQNYYRLKQVDLDGTVAYSPIVTVRTGAQDAGGFLITPNPASDQVELRFAEDQVGQTVQVSVFDVSGKQVFNQQHQLATVLMNLPVGSLAAGIYTVRAQTNTSVYSAKLVVE